MDEQTAKKAAKWWADQLRKPCRLDNGDQSATGDMAMMLQSAQGLPPCDRVDAFEEELCRCLAALRSDWVSLGVDYDPDWILRQCADCVGLQAGMGMWPWKTHMSIHGNVVMVSEGYRAGPVII